jgi:hypothetical protein
MTVKLAAYIKVGYCEHCKDPHIVLFDENDEAFAEAVLYAEHGPHLIQELQKILYHSAVNKDT